MPTDLLAVPRYPSGILVSCQVPWDPDERLMEEVFREQIRMLRGRGFDQVYIFGTAGEGHAVDLRRFTEIATIFRDETLDRQVRPMVGVIAQSTATTVERIAIGYELGFRVFQIALPSWGAVNDQELLTFFKDVCGTFPDAGFLHYNLPRAARLLTGPDYRRLLDLVPNLVATKNTGGGAERARDLMQHAPELQHFFGELNFAHGALLGECSLLGSMAPMAPDAARKFFEAGRRKDRSGVSRFAQYFKDLLDGVLGELLPLKRMDGAYDKIITRLGGLESMPLRLLSPYQGFTEEEFERCRKRYVEDFHGGVSPGNC